MAVLIQIHNAHKSYGDQVLLDGAEASIVENAKIGFVGRNGCGKSTLLRIILGEEELELGEVIRHPKLRIGYLRQHDAFKPEESALDFLMRDSGQTDWKCGEVAGKFELKGEYLNGPISSLSGGWQTRVKLAALLLHEPNLLLLDEPTNFLDLRTQILLENFLRSFRSGVLMVSHDRGFLQQTCDETLDLSRGKLTSFSGKINEFLVFQQERKEHDMRVNQTVLTKQKQLKKFIDRNRAGANTASQARSKQKQLDRLKTEEIAREEATARIRAPLVERRQGTVLRCQDLTIGYDGEAVAAGINFEIEHGQRVAIVGDNGEGKTTLLRSIVGSLKKITGEVKWGHASNIGTYAQHVYSTLPEQRTVYEHLEYEALGGTTRQQILATAGALLFRDSHVNKKIRVLSGGERARLCMAGLLLGDYNILVLDEPGNHLDVETVDALAEALLKYQGTVVFTSHERHFLGRIATNIVEVGGGTAKSYLGDYDSYMYMLNRESQGEEQGGKPAKSGKSNGDGGGRKSNDRDLQKRQRKLRREIQNLEKKIADLDRDKQLLNKQLVETTDADEALKVHTKFTEVSDSLARAEDRWLELTEAL
ncbi:MAG: ABC-F family ATP-binding cassette domain-containing protein [Planctomycetota bacterium]|nr:ABC-F family ATP-binding cassette domain-containing protein [Planctomycetota bacterium]